MEQGEDNFVVGSIGWLAQTILASLFAGKLEAWIRELGLADDIEKLKSEIEIVEMVAAAVKGRAAGNRPLARSLARLKELLYDADDAIDELDYYRLKQQVEGGTCRDPDGTDGRGEEQLERSRGDAWKPRSPAWKHFKVTKFNEKGKPEEAKCIHCQTSIQCGSKNGTSVLGNHLESVACKKKHGASDSQANTSNTADGEANGTPPTVGDSGRRKRKRMPEESGHNTAGNTHPWNKGEFSNRIQQLTGQLKHIRGAVSEVLNQHGSDSVPSSNHYQSTRSEVCPRSSSVNQQKIYGRVTEKDSIMKMIAGDKHDGVTVLPIVGIGGVGKTALAQHVYNDSTVKSQFDRIWVWVSDNFDKVRLTREMLDFVYQERHEGSPEERGRHEGVSSFAKLQEILKGHMELQSKRFLLILDDVWESMDDCQWDKLLAPLKSSQVKGGNVILVTTRQLSVAQRIGTIGPIKLGALANEDFWLLFKACAFGDENYNGHRSLSTIGRQIADKLKGNPLAAETAGALLRKQLTIDHWSNILKNEDWKSLQLSRGIMPALMLSYDQLPYHLQQCFSYCSIFPNNYCFLSEELIRIWIAQGFVIGSHSSKRLEEIGRDYLFDLVNSGFFQQAERDVFSPGKQTCYVMCGLMHDFAMVVSRAECATIDGLQCNEMLPTVHHLSILTDSAYNKDPHGNIPRNDKCEKKLLSVVTSVRKLRSLVLIGQYDPYFLQLFQNLFNEAQNLRLLQISTTYDGSNSFMCNVANLTHLRYLKLMADEKDGALAQVLSKFYHLQVLDVGSYTDIAIFIGVNNLGSLRHLVAEEDSSIASIAKMTSLQELHNFRVQNSSGFEITQLQSMNELVQLGVSQLENVKTREDAYGAGLTNKQHLEQLHLSWNNGPSSETCTTTAREVLEGLEPHYNLRHLRISGYNGATAPTWLATSLISLQTLRLECCGKLQILPSLERLPFLRKFELRNMLNITEVPIPSLDELVLDEMPMLEKCSCTSVRDLNSSLNILKIMRCAVLKIFPLFESSEKFKIEQKSWLSNLRELIIHECPQLLVPHPLPPSTSVSELSIWRVSILPTMKGSSNETLRIGGSEYYGQSPDEFSKELRTLDGKMLSFHNLRFLTKLKVYGCQNLTSISLEGFSQLISLKIFEIRHCENLFSPHVLPEDTLVECNALPSLECLRIVHCGITGKWLSIMLRRVHALQELDLGSCPQITWLSVEEENNQSNLISDPEASSSGCPDDTSSISAPEGLLHIPLNLIPSLKKISISGCRDLTFCSNGLAGFTSLEELIIEGCPKLLSSLVHKDGNDDQANGRRLLPLSLLQLHFGGNYYLETLQPCFSGNLNCLKKLTVQHCRSLKSLQLHSCTALEELTMEYCDSLAALEGLQSLGGLRHLEVSWNESLKSLQLHCCTALEELKIRGCGSLGSLEGLQSLGGLRHLEVYECPGFPPCSESLSMQGLISLETLRIDGPSILTTLFCKHLISLQCLELRYYWESDVMRLTDEQDRLTDEQERALQLLTTLQDLRFRYLWNLVHLPAGLHSLPSLKRLEISFCDGISRLPEKGLPPSLEKLVISGCSKELTEQCRTLATSKLKVKTNGVYVN